MGATRVRRWLVLLARNRVRTASSSLYGNESDGTTAPDFGYPARSTGGRCGRLSQRQWRQPRLDRACPYRIRIDAINNNAALVTLDNAAIVRRVILGLHFRHHFACYRSAPHDWPREFRCDLSPRSHLFVGANATVVIIALGTLHRIAQGRLLP